jgi:hypothetical protein
MGKAVGGYQPDSQINVGVRVDGQGAPLDARKCFDCPYYKPLDQRIEEHTEYFRKLMDGGWPYRKEDYDPVDASVRSESTLKGEN